MGEALSQLPPDAWALIKPFVDVLALLGLPGVVIAYLLLVNFRAERRADKMRDENAAVTREAVKMGADTGYAITRLTDAAIRGDFGRLKLPSETTPEAGA